MNNQNASTAGVAFPEALKVWAKIGLLSFGGPAGQIALMHKVVVEERGWLSEREYLAALNFCMLLPGPEAMQLATYSGWKLHGTKGGLAAGLLFVLPGAVIVLALTMLYAHFGKLPLVEAVFYGVKAAVLAIVIEALLRVARRALKTRADWAIAALAFAALFFFALPFPLVILAAALVGVWRASGAAEAHQATLPGWRALAGTVALWGAVWLVPLAGLALLLGPHHVLTEVGVFFSKLALVTFGGAYAVLAYMAQAAVETRGWLSATEMMDGLALAETTPGPLILVTQFVGYFAGLRETGSVWGGLAAAAVTLWMTFAPCFLWIFAGAPYVGALGKRPRLSGALAAITAAVVGVILNLSLWFGLHVLFGHVERLPGWFRPWAPDWTNLDGFALALSGLAALALLRFRLGILPVLMLSAALGAASKLPELVSI
ncbi:chromate efflux transporter [Aestuariivirga sp.]|uniref:chromate efflux transporter n=1 Tax=Aestuariivirga sp. TaxID=2650926 RepID=UPI0025C6589B|nr:chromate efflux transporter [Aestuariivirga sp.]MCA3556494.1 chromate efflux transporter [Aestuariivirga sp.]